MENTASSIVSKGMFTAPLSNKISIRCHGIVFSDPLPSNAHGMDHIENLSRDIGSTVACAYFGSCLEMSLHVKILTHNGINAQVFPE
jgi:hypothetical protein